MWEYYFKNGSVFYSNKFFILLKFVFTIDKTVTNCISDSSFIFNFKLVDTNFDACYYINNNIVWLLNLGPSMVTELGRVQL